MKLEQLLESYGHISMGYMEQDGLYYFRSTNPIEARITIACEFMPNLLTPQSTLPLIHFNDVNIVGVIKDMTLTVYDEAYVLPLTEFFLSIKEETE